MQPTMMPPSLPPARPMQQAAPFFGHTAPQPQFSGTVKFAGSGKDGGGFFAAFKSIFSSLGALLNGKARKLEESPEVALEKLQNAIEALSDESAESTEIKNEIAGNALRAEAELRELTAQKEVKEAEALDSADTIEKLQAGDKDLLARLEIKDDTQLAAFIAEAQTAADEAAQAALDIDQRLQAAQTRLAGLEKSAEAAKARDAEIQEQLKLRRQQLRDMQTMVKETKQNERYAQMDAKLKAMEGKTVGGNDEVDQLIDRLKDNAYTAHAAVQDDGTADKIIARRRLSDLNKAKNAGSALEKLKARKAAEKEAGTEKTADAGSGGNFVSDNS
jgi:hypothetical protein